MKGFAKAGQTHCWDCGRAFEPDQVEWDETGVVSTSCPTEGCNRGSWWHREPDLDYCVPVGDLSTAAAAATMGRKGGRAKSAAKTAAMRENGRKGGRPRQYWVISERWSRTRERVSFRDISDQAAVYNRDLDRDEVEVIMTTRNGCEVVVDETGDIVAVAVRDWGKWEGK